MSHAQSKQPLVVTERLQLTQLGIPLEHITWPRVTMTSDKFICIQHGLDRKKESVKKPKHHSMITMLTLQDSGSVPFSSLTLATSAKMNPVKPILALKAKNVFQIFDIANQKLMYKYKVNYKITYWTWVDHETIVIVSDTSIYHWIMSDDHVPVKMFDRHSRLSSDFQITNYAADEYGAWMSVVGLSLHDNKVVGVAQLYSLSRNYSQPLEAHAVCFTTYCFHGNKHPSVIFIAATRSEITGIGKVYIVELGPHQHENAALVNHSDSFDFNSSFGQYDFPVSIQACKLGLIYVVSKFGHVYLCDIETGMCLYVIMISPDITFTSVLNHKSNGILVISRNGQVLSVDVEDSILCDYVRYVLKRPAMASRLATSMMHVDN